MSIKTLRKRIALVAVSALGAGLMSVVAAPVARAAEAAAGDSGVILVSGAICAATNGAGGAPIAADGTTADASPFESGSTAGRIITVPVGGAIKVAYDAADLITMSGPLTISSLTSQGGAVTTNATVTATNGKTIINGNAADADVTLSATAVGTGVLTVDTTSADPVVTAANTIYVNIVAACSNTTYSATTSYVYVKGTDATAAATTTNVDSTLSATAGNSLYVNLTMNNAYAVALNTGTIAVSATNGALVNLGNAATTAPTKGTTTSVTLAGDGTSILRVDPAQTATTSTTTVTITHNGSAVATKVLTFFGEQASISVVKVASGRSGTGDTGYVMFQYKDSAGNVVPGGAAAFVAATAGTQITTGTSILAPGASSSTLIGTALADNVERAAGSSTANGVLAYTCGTARGTQAFKIATTSTVNANTLTADVTGKCYGGIASYKVSTDKATYKVGEIAVITVDAKDASGNPVSDNTQLAAGSFSIGGGSPTYTILGTDAAAATEVFTDGKVTLRAQMTTAGSFNTVVQLAGLAETAGYTITDGAVSNAEVLAAIVKLIASINKQIKALQKSLRR